MRSAWFRADLIEAGLNEAAGRFARLGGYGDCSRSSRRIVWLGTGTGEEKREHGPLFAVERASRLTAAFDLNHRMAAIRRHGGAGLRSSAMIGATGIMKRRMMIVVYLNMARLTMSRTRMATGGIAPG